MNEVDVERQRLHIRVWVTKWAIYLGVIAIIYVVTEYLKTISEINWTFLILAVLVYGMIDMKFENPVRKFYERRLMNSKNRSHTT